MSIDRVIDIYYFPFKDPILGVIFRGVLVGVQCLCMYAQGALLDISLKI